MHLGLIVFFMVFAPVYLNKGDQQPNEDNKISNNSLCPKNEVLLETLRHLKNLINDMNSNFDPEKVKNILDTMILHLNSEFGKGNSTGKNYTSHFTTIGENFTLREKKEAFGSNPYFGAQPEMLKGSIGLQYQLPMINHSDCATLFKAILDAINVAYLQLSNFCLESGKCYLQSSNILPPRNIPRPVPTIFPQMKNLPSPNQSVLSNQSNIIDFLGSYPNGDVISLLQKYRPNMGNGNYLSVPTSNVPNTQYSAQGNLFNHDQNEKYIYDSQNPNPLAILQSFRPKYINSIKNYGKQIPHEDHQINAGFQENGNTWTPFQQFKPNVPNAVKDNFSSSGQFTSTINNVESTGGWDDLTRDQSLVEVQTVLNQPTGYIVGPGAQVIPQPNGNDIKTKLPTLQPGINVPYKQSMGGMPYYQGNGFNIKPPMNVQMGIYYPNAHVSPVSQNGKNYLNQNYFNQIEQYYPNAANNPNLQIPTSNIFVEKQLSNWYQNQKAFQNPYQNSGMSSIYQGPVSDSTFANQNHRDIPKELNDLYRLTMTNRAKLNITPNKNGIVELTFTLQRPQSFVYKPLYYVKYRLPYQTYMYNVKNILQKRPLLRNDPAKLYEGIIEVANMSESSQDLKQLAKEEISKLVVKNGALVKATVIDENGNQNSTFEDEMKGALQMASNLNPAAMLNASKMALNQVEEAINTTVPKTTKLNKVDERSEFPIKGLNTRSIRYPFYPQLTNLPLMNANGAYSSGPSLGYDKLSSNRS